MINYLASLTYYVKQSFFFIVYVNGKMVSNNPTDQFLIIEMHCGECCFSCASFYTLEVVISTFENISVLRETEKQQLIN